MIKKIWNVIFVILMAFVAVLALLVLGARLFGLRTYVVLTGSMEPSYHVGSIVYVKSVDPETLEVGDAITFCADGRATVTHRIIQILPGEEDPGVIRFRTKGDNNTIADGTPVDSTYVLGKVVGTIPLLGYLFDYLLRPPGAYLILAAAPVLALVAFLPDIINGFKPQPEEEPEE